MQGLDSKKLRIKMAERDITQAELARRTGIEPSYMSLILRNGKNIGVDYLRRICDVLQCSAEEIW